MELRPGYKQTEVGVIPAEWDVASLRDVAQIRSGIAVNANSRVSDPVHVHYLRVANVQDGYLDLTEMSQLEVSRNDLHRFSVMPGDVLMNEGGDRDKLGRGSIWRGEFDRCVHQNHVFVVRCRDSILPDFLTNWSAGATARRYFVVAGKQTTNLASINKTSLGGLPVVLPEKWEQRAIAEALSDVDDLLGGLDRLIAKKRDLKQAAMQQLLTGQTRLPGFEGEWEVRRLGDHLTFLRNGVNSRAELQPEGSVGYLHYGDVHACKDVFISPKLLPCLPAEKAASLDRLRDGDLIFADASEDMSGVGKSVELKDVRSAEVVSGLHTVATRFDKAVFANGFKGFLQFCPPFVSHLRRLAAGTKVYATNRAHIASVEMCLPSVTEQTAIATVLSDMDAELSALEARRDKTRALKQAMMQELLTGRIRLVAPMAQVIPLPEKKSAAPAKSGHNEHFNEAVVIAVLAKHFGCEAYPLGRFRYTKLSYLLHRYAEKKTEQYLRKAAGPYNPKTRYGGAEKIALAKAYVREHHAEKFAGFVAAAQVDEAERYFHEWYGDEVLPWLDRFRKTSNEELELFATVFGAIDEVSKAGGKPSFKSVRKFIQDDPIWRDKLQRPLFSDDNIVRAGKLFRELFGEPPVANSGDD